MDGEAKKEGRPQEAGWQYRPGYEAPDPFLSAGEPNASAVPQNKDGEAVEWSASEFVAHEKNFGWYAVLALVATLVAAGLYLITRDTFSMFVVIMMVLIMGAAGARKPRVITYRVDGSGVTVGRNFHPYREYKSFTLSEDGPFNSIILTPMKRFGFPLSAYLAPDSQQKALDVISGHLPMERGKPDAVDQLMRQLRF